MTEILTIQLSALKETLLIISNIFTAIGIFMYSISIILLIIYYFKHTQKIYDIGFPMTINGGILILIGFVLSQLLS